ncbi:helix-turn-helix domain-containing protein [Pelosinus sp. sgz500959]|uniref:helix-turn-helix domain-containing protein n=1 Tax=Pelosinus sp. sgz500959 TaxID=3242472 RepID=UPI00366AEB58
MKVDINELAGYFSTININLINMVRSVVPPGGKCFGVFTPPYSSFIFPLHGRARMFFDGIPYIMDPGKIFHSGPNMTLDKEVLGRFEWDFMVIHYRVDGDEKDGLSYGSSHYQLDPGQNTRINDMLHRLYHMCNTPGNLATLRAKSLFFSLLDEIFTCANHQRNDNNRDLIEQSIEYIKIHYMQPLTIPELAEQHGLNSKQFAYLFQKYMGIGPNEYLIDRRMRHAKELLCATTSSVAEISACVGYSDPYYFSKLFKKRTGFCPSALQRSF